MRFVIVTGMSGSGKRTAMKMLEDLGFYCVDNLPVLILWPVPPGRIRALNRAKSPPRWLFHPLSH